MKLCYMQEKWMELEHIILSKISWPKTRDVLSHMLNLDLKNEWQECKMGTVCKSVGVERINKSWE
jgi:hypothetical protein